MIHVDQVIVDAGHGDCLQACTASILEVRMSAVPNFGDAPEGLFHSLYRAVMYGYGWHVCDVAVPKGVTLWHGCGIDDCYIASVPSRNIDGTHAVVINADGLVVHDPSPHKNYQDENVFKTEQIHHFDTYQARTDDSWNCFHAMMVRAKMRKNHEQACKESEPG